MLPPLPAPGLQNCLCSTASSQFVSINGRDGHSIKKPDIDLTQNPLVSSKVASAHAAGTSDLFVFEHKKRIIVNDCWTGTSITSSFKLHFEAQDMAVRRFETSNRVLVAIAGYDGVYCCTFCLHDGTVTELYPLSGSSGYPCVCVDVGEDGSIAVGTMDGRVAVWGVDVCAMLQQGLQSYASAECVLQPPTNCPSGDRTTQLMFVEYGGKQNLLVAWWSGCFERYVQKEGQYDIDWTLCAKSKEMCDFHAYPGSFIAVCDKEPVVAFSQNGKRLYFIALESGAKEVFPLTDKDAMMKGLCATSSGLVVWLYEALKLLKLKWPTTIPSIQYNCGADCGELGECDSKGDHTGEDMTEPQRT